MTDKPAMTMREIRKGLGHNVPPDDLPVPLVRPTEYTVSLLPEDDINAPVFEITVQYRGAGRWAVTRGEHACLGRDGTWARGVKPYDRGDAWIAAHRFDRETALQLAREAAPAVMVNGITALQAYARTATRDLGPLGGESEARRG